MREISQVAHNYRGEVESGRKPVHQKNLGRYNKKGTELSLSPFL